MVRESLEAVASDGGRETAASAAHRSIFARTLAAWSWRRYLTPALTGLFGIAVLALAVPHTVGTFLLLREPDTMAAIRQGRYVTPFEIDGLVASRLAAARWIDAAEPWSDIAMARFARLRDADLSPVGRRDALAQAEMVLRRLLARAPADALAWAQLAYIRFARDDHAGAGVALELSIASGWTWRSVLLWRNRLALAHWPHLDRRTRELFRREFAVAMVRDPEAFAELAIQAEGTDLVRDALAGSFSLQQRFDELVGYKQEPDMAQDRYERESAFGTQFEDWLYQFDY